MPGRDAAGAAHRIEPASSVPVPTPDPCALAHRAAHDLAGPLGRIEAFAALLQEDLADADEDVLHSLEIVSRSAHGAGALVRRLLALALSACRPLERRAVDVRTVVDAALDALAEDVSRTGATVSVGALGALDADAELLTLACTELVSNAVAAGGPGHRPRIGIELARAPTGTPLRLTVSDDGTGLPAEHRARLLEPFESGAAAGGANGAGLGLALCRIACDRHGWGLELADVDGFTEVRIMIG